MWKVSRCNTTNRLRIIQCPTDWILLVKIVQLIRSILFSGLLRKYRYKLRTMLYHIGVNVEKLHSLLSNQIKVSMCFESREEDKACSLMDNEIA